MSTGSAVDLDELATIVRPFVLRKLGHDSALMSETIVLQTDGCSGAEIVAICQDAALAAMNAHFVDSDSTADGEDDGPVYVDRRFIVEAARSVRRRITLDMVRGYEEWRDQSGVTIV